jgi:hypothetical protein
VVQEEGTLLAEINRSDRFRVPIQRDWSDQFQNQSDRFGGRRVTNLRFMLMEMVVSVPLVVMLVVGMLCLVVLRLLDAFHLVVYTSLGDVVALSLRGAADHGLSFVVLVLL